MKKLYCYASPKGYGKTYYEFKKLQQENQKLKESNKNQKDIFLKEIRRKEKQYINRITRKNKDMCELREKLELYKSVLDEIREILKEYKKCSPGFLNQFRIDLSKCFEILDKVKK